MDDSEIPLLKLYRDLRSELIDDPKKQNALEIKHTSEGIVS